MQPSGKSEADEDPHPWSFSKGKLRGSRQQYAGETKAMWKICLIKLKAAVYKEKTNTGMTNNIRFAHLNASSFVKSEVQHMILRQLGKQIHFLNVVETHTTPQLESSLRKRYPHVVFYFNHGNKQANKENCKEGKKGTMIAVVEGLVKLGDFKIHEKGQLATLDFQLGARDYRFISVYVKVKPQAH